MGLKKVRIQNFPQDVTNRPVREASGKYAEVRRTTEEQCTNAYRYLVLNGIKIIGMNLRKPLPCHMNIPNSSVLVCYEGQPSTCYGCGDMGHQYQDCSQRKHRPNNNEVTSPTKWSDIVIRLHQTLTQ
jgi:hypothetical protein